MKENIYCISGSRHARNYERFCIWMENWKLVFGVPSRYIFGEATGIDRLAFRYCVENKIPYTVYFAPWNYGACAGPMRNNKMLEIADQLWAFPCVIPGKQSKGTRQAINRAGDDAIGVHIHRIGDPIWLESESSDFQHLFDPSRKTRHADVDNTGGEIFLVT